MSPIGYDMYTVLPMSDEDQAAYEAATTACFTAVKVLDALPASEAGEFDPSRADPDETAIRPSHDMFPGRSERFKAAEDALEAANEERARCNRSYFRLNIGGMSLFAQLMNVLGMLMGSDTRPPNWPSADGFTEQEMDAAYDLCEERLKELAVRYGPRTDTAALKGEEPSTETVSKAVSDYVDAHLFKLLWVPEPVTGIYAGKFGSNDGWAVTPKEIRAALGTYRKWSAVQVADLLKTAGVTEYRAQRWHEWIDFLVYAEEHGGFTVH